MSSQKAKRNIKNKLKFAIMISRLQDKLSKPRKSFLKQTHFFKNFILRLKLRQKASYKNTKNT